MFISCSYAAAVCVSALSHLCYTSCSDSKFLYLHRLSCVKSDAPTLR